jgi:hypothetical protein
VGAIGGDFNVGEGDAVSDWGVIVTMPMQARDALGDDDVYVTAARWSGSGGQTSPTTTDGSANCTGTLAAPTAPPGKVCVYIAGGDNADDVNGWSIIPDEGKSRFGFKLGWTATETGDTFIDAVWVYQAA